MTDKEIIRAWVKRREELLRAACKHSEAAEMAVLLSYIDSMQEEPASDKLGGINNALIQDKCVQEYPVCDDLEKEIGEFISASIVGIQYCRHAIVEWGKMVARHFANWQKQQMMKDTVRGYVKYDDTRDENPYVRSESFYWDSPYRHLCQSDEIELIIIKK